MGPVSFIHQKMQLSLSSPPPSSSFVQMLWLFVMLSDFLFLFFMLFLSTTEHSCADPDPLHLALQRIPN